MENIELDIEVIKLLNSVFCRYSDIEKVVIFGSRAKGTARLILVTGS